MYLSERAISVDIVLYIPWILFRVVQKGASAHEPQRVQWRSSLKNAYKMTFTLQEESKEKTQVILGEKRC